MRDIQLARMKDTNCWSIIEIKDGKPIIIGNIELYENISRNPDIEEEGTLRVYI